MLTEALSSTSVYLHRVNDATFNSEKKIIAAAAQNYNLATVPMTATQPNTQRIANSIISLMLAKMLTKGFQTCFELSFSLSKVEPPEAFSVSYRALTPPQEGAIR